MANITISFAMTPYDRVLPLINGEVKPDGITLDYIGMPGSFPRVYYEQIRFQRYDLSEMSLSSFLRMRSIRWPYRMLPVFHNRTFSHTTVLIRRSSGIRQGHPEDLKGKRMGVGDYQQTLGLWTRGILQTEFDVKPEDMIWYQENSEHFSHTGASAQAGLPLPKGIKLNYAKTGIGAMFLNNELDASVSLSLKPGRLPSMANYRQRVAPPDNPDVTTLFPDPRKEAIRYFKKTGIYPPHHTTVIRESILDEHPWVAVSLMEAFEESKRIAVERLRQLPPTLLMFGEQYLKELDEVFGPDPNCYGIKANLKAFDQAQAYSIQQGLTERKQPLEEIFPVELIYREERL